MKRKAGVTIVELIVVLVIVAMMVAILFPVFAKSHNHHPTNRSCASNLKQIGLGMIQYYQDNNELFPPRQAQSGRHGELVSWRALLDPYTKNKNVYQCPDNLAADAADIEHDGFNRSYAVNSTLVAKLGASAPMSDAYGGKSSLAQINNLATVILATETTAAFNDLNMALPNTFTSPYSPSRNTGSLYAGHDGYSLYLFSDGHVKGWRPAQTLDMDGKNLWTRDNSAFSTAESMMAQKILQYSQRQYPPMHG